jgi:hypothetical protein
MAQRLVSGYHQPQGFGQGGILMDEVQGYCVKCKAQRTMKDAHEEKMDNGRRAAKGVCETCGTKMTKFLPNEKK